MNVQQVKEGTEMKYDFKKIEPKWQKKWEDAGIFRAVDCDHSRKKFYGLIEFPYPSGAGMPPRARRAEWRSRSCRWS